MGRCTLFFALAISIVAAACGTPSRAIAQEPAPAAPIPPLPAAWAAAWSSGDAGQVAALYTPDGVYEQVPTGNVAAGRDAVQALVADTHASFADVRVTPRMGFQGEGWAVLSADFSGRTPTGTSFSLPFVVVFTLEGGQIVHNADYFDLDALLAAVAAPPAEGAPAPATRPGGQTAAIDGVALYYEVHGPDDGHPVLLLHGLIDNLESFDHLVPALVAAGYRTIAFDARGRGRSAWGAEPFTYALMATDAVALLDHLGIERTDVIGASAGATLALELAIHHPERVHRIVAYAGSFTVAGEHDPAMSPRLEAIFEQIVADYQRLSPEPERLAELLEVTSAWEEVEPNIGEDQLRGISVPVLILDGESDEFVYPEHTKRMAELIPNARLAILPGTGHFALSEQPEEFARIVLEFLQAKP